MHPGKYPHRAIFTEPSGTKDAIGNVSASPTEVGRAWVSVEPLPSYARERLAPGGETASATHRVSLMRPAFDVSLAASLTVSGREFRVTAVMDTPNAASVMLLCSERQS